MISLNLKKRGLFSSGIIQSAIQGTPLFSMIILWILTSIAPANIANVLMYISTIGLLITCIYYGFRMVRWLIRAVISKEIDYDGIGITFDNKEDYKIINIDIIPRLKELHKTQNIERIVIFQ